MSATQTTGTVDAAEVAKFEAMAAEWWDPNGKFRPLHKLGPARIVGTSRGRRSRYRRKGRFHSRSCARVAHREDPNEKSPHLSG